MGKTNFTKVEEVLDQGLRKYSVDHLLEMADEASGAQPGEKSKTSSLTKEQRQLLKVLNRVLISFKKKEHPLYAELGMTRKELKKRVENASSLTSEEWEALAQLSAKIASYKAD